MVAPAAPDTATFSEFAALAGFQRSYVTQLRKAGRLVLDDRGRVRVAETQARIQATADPSKTGVAARHAAERAEQQAQDVGAVPAPAPAPDAATDRIGSSYQAARAVREKYMAMEAKRAYDQAMGKLLKTDDVVAALADAMATLRTRFESMPVILGPQLAAESDEHKVIATLTDTVEHALNEASREMRSATNPNGA